MIKCNNIEAAEKLIQFLYDSRNQIQCSQIIDIQVDSMTSQVYIKNTVLNRIVQMYNKNQNEIYIYDYLAQNPQFFFNQTGTQISFSDETFKMFVDNYLNSKDVALLTSIGGNVQVCVDSKIISSEAIRLLERKIKPSRIAKQQYQTKICLEKLLNIIKSDFIMASSKLSTIQQLDIIFNNISLEDSYSFYSASSKAIIAQLGLVTVENFHSYLKQTYSQEYNEFSEYIHQSFQHLNLKIKHFEYKTEWKFNIRINALINGMYLKTQLSELIIKQLKFQKSSSSNNLALQLFMYDKEQMKNNVIYAFTDQIESLVKSLIFVAGVTDENSFLLIEKIGIMTQQALQTIKTNGPPFICQLNDKQYYKYIFDITQQNKLIEIQITSDLSFKDILPHYYITKQLNNDQLFELNFIQQQKNLNQFYICQKFENLVNEYMAQHYTKIDVEFCLIEAIYVIIYYQNIEFNIEIQESYLIQQNDLQSVLQQFIEKHVFNLRNVLQFSIFKDMLQKYYAKHNICFSKCIKLYDNYKIKSCVSNIFRNNLNKPCVGALQKLSTRYSNIILNNNQLQHYNLQLNYLRDLNASIYKNIELIKDIIKDNLTQNIYILMNHTFSEEQLFSIISSQFKPQTKSNKKLYLKNCLQRVVTFDMLFELLKQNTEKYDPDYILQYSLNQAIQQQDYKIYNVTIDQKQIKYFPQLFIADKLTNQSQFCIEYNTTSQVFENIKQFIKTNYTIVSSNFKNNYENTLMHIIYHQDVNVEPDKLQSNAQNDSESSELSDEMYTEKIMNNYSESVMECSGVVTCQQIQRQILTMFFIKIPTNVIIDLVLQLFPKANFFDKFQTDKYRYIIKTDTIFYNLYNKNLKEKTKQVIQLLHDDTSDIIPEMVNEFEQIISEHYEFKEYDKDVDTFVIDQNYTTMDLIMLRFKQSFGKKFIIKHCCKALENKKLSMATCYKVLDGHSDMDYYIQDLVLNLYSKYDTQLSNKKRQLIRYYKSESWKFTIRLIHNEELEQIFKPFLSENYHILRHNKQQSVINDILIKSSKNKLNYNNLQQQLGLVSLQDIYDKLIKIQQTYLQVTLRHQTFQKLFGFHCEPKYNIWFQNKVYNCGFIYFNLFDKSIVDQKIVDQIQQ
ncbi:Hypothetical_protein [Hexamita inflata]|uniref:Hypothetical_protein n=1 Tax=Hexamita inflata TaxID=28002 RepID=A0AA86UFJ8_9EUKA|nr:Hypothetical protein HINF_LOCUS43830 [Hexamita inflata]